MVQKARDARLLRSLLQLAPPRGVTRASWRRYLQREVRPRVERVLVDLGQPVEGPAAEPEDLEPPAARMAPRTLTKPRNRRAVTIRESLARIIDKADPLLGDTLDERVDALLTIALTDRPALRTTGGR